MQEEEVNLTKTEFLILEYFMKNKGLSCSREKIIIGVWGYDFDGEEKIVDVYINSLRKKIDVDNKYIHTIRGFGYMFQSLLLLVFPFFFGEKVKKIYKQ